MVVISKRHLRRVLFWYVDYYHRSRTHLSLDKDCPDARPIQPPNRGKVIAIPQVGGASPPLRTPGRLTCFRGLHNLRRWPLCGKPCHRVQNPQFKYRLHGLTSVIGDQLVRFIAQYSPQPRI